MNIPVGELCKPEDIRDAVHVAIAPVTCDIPVHPGQHIGISETDKSIADPVGEPVGIVDPFLMKKVMPGERFWLCLYPNTVTGLQHVWTHPKFDGQPEDCIGDAEEWLREFADQTGLSYDSMIEKVTEYAKHDEVWTERDSEQVSDAWYDLKPEGEKLFWKYFTEVTGLKKEDVSHDWDAPFSCSC